MGCDEIDISKCEPHQQSPWLVQECFNVICATTNILVDECTDVMLSSPEERKKLAQGVLDLLLHVLITPLSTVTLSRGLGGASQILEKFGPSIFLSVVGDSLQHWARVILTHMNNVSLAVRSLAVDFLVSLFGGTFDEFGSVDEISLVILTIMPEVVAREIALYTVSGQISTMENIESCLWPLRRSLGDLEDVNPLDDDRVDVQLAPFLGTFSQSCQAIIDGVLIELRLRDDLCDVVGTQIECGWNRGKWNIFKTSQTASSSGNDYKGRMSILSDKQVGYTSSAPLSASWWGHAFDADEESLFEAAKSFLPEVAPIQRLRWLFTLRALHEAKGQWVEAAETLVLCARTVAEAIPHIKSVWRPSRFALWTDVRRSLWLMKMEKSGKSNEDIMKFAEDFLEPPDLLGRSRSKFDKKAQLAQPTVPLLCQMLTSITKEIVLTYLEEDGMEELAFFKLEQLLRIVMGVVDDNSAAALKNSKGPNYKKINHTEIVEENAALRKMSASLNGDLTKLAERMLLLADDGDEEICEAREAQCRQYYARVILLGRKPERFNESTTIPTFLEFGSANGKPP